jgi:hypothetical protein
MPTVARPPQVSLLEASLVCKEPPPGEVDKQVLDPFTPGVSGVPCLVVSRPLRDPVDRVADKASHPLNKQTRSISVPIKFWGLDGFLPQILAHGLGLRLLPWHCPGKRWVEVKLG